VLESNEYDGRADIWSLGCVIFVLCNSRPDFTPFMANSEKILIERIKFLKHRQLNDSINIEIR